MKEKDEPLGVLIAEAIFGDLALPVGLVITIGMIAFVVANR